MFFFIFEISSVVYKLRSWGLNEDVISVVFLYIFFSFDDLCFCIKRNGLVILSF